MRRPLLLVAFALACALAAPRAQTSRLTEFEWTADETDTGLTAEIERDGVPVSCGTAARPTATTRRCSVTMPTGTASFRARMANIDLAFGEWSAPVVATIPPLVTGDPPGPFVVRFPLPGAPGGGNPVLVPQTLPLAYGVDTATTRGTSVTTGSPAGTFGTIVQLTASLPVDAIGFWAFLRPTAGATIQLRVYIGAAAAEVEIATISIGSVAAQTAALFVPVQIPSGSRVSVATAGSSTGSVSYVLILPMRGSSIGGGVASRGTLLGITSGAPIDVDAGVTAHTKGAWVEVTASTARDAKGFTLKLHGDAGSGSATDFLFDMAIGAAAAEQVILADVASSQEAFRTEMKQGEFGPFWTPIPAGTRIAVRVAASSNVSTVRVPRAAIMLWE